MLNREHILAILYDVTSTLASEVHLSPLLSKTLQRMMFHTAYPVGCILLKNGEGVVRLESAIGDALLNQHLGEVVELSDSGEAFIAALPCRQGVYLESLRLPVGDIGEIVLLAKSSVQSDLPFVSMFEPVMATFAHHIKLCQLNDRYQGELEKQVEERTRLLHQSQALFRLLLESLAEGIYGVDLKGEITFANSSFLRLLGYGDASEVMGRPSHELMHHHRADGEVYPAEECSIYRSYQSGEKIYRGDEVFWRKDGSCFPVEYYSTPVISESGEVIGAVISFSDITEKLEKAADEARMRDRFEHVQRLESLGVLAGGIAHDFNNLLTAIMGNASLARSAFEASGVEPYLDRIEAASKSAADLCGQMLAYSGKGRFIVKSINLSELVKEMSKLLEVSIPKSIVIRYDLSASLPAVEADVTQIRQVVMNLVTNASEAIGENSGVISLTTGLMHLDQEYLQRLELEEGLPEGYYTFLEVSDTGCGMDRATRNKLFEPFFTTKFTGRGLGMSAVLGIVLGHHGAIKIYSEIGKGTTFKVLLPTVGRIAESIPIPGSVDEDWCATGKALIIDDEESVREMASLMMKKMGFETLLAKDGQEGVELLRKHKDDIAVVLLDMSMPHMDGQETFTEIKRIRDDMKVVLSSGYNEQDATSRFAGKGLADFIQKPYKYEQLHAVMHRVMVGEK